MGVVGYSRPGTAPERHGVMTLFVKTSAAAFVEEACDHEDRWHWQILFSSQARSKRELEAYKISTYGIRTLV